jgi:hypothetical protein
MGPQVVVLAVDDVKMLHVPDVVAAVLWTQRHFGLAVLRCHTAIKTDKLTILFHVSLLYDITYCLLGWVIFEEKCKKS